MNSTSILKCRSPDEICNSESAAVKLNMRPQNLSIFNDRKA